ncbi:MAG: hypothetical protein IKX57_05060 [Oscillospiraceae bacterium]|nr:hypothetical protein [Oscillospiraceae bacterium]
MPEIRLIVRNKRIFAEEPPVIVCGNSDYTLYFDPDAEWAPFREKTARFFWYDNRRRTYLHTDVLFAGNAVTVPVLRDTNEVAVGLYAGALHATAPFRIPCAEAVTDGSDIPEVLPQPLYTQLLSYLRELAEETAVRQAVRVQHGITVHVPVYGTLAPIEETGGQYVNP